MSVLARCAARAFSLLAVVWVCSSAGLAEEPARRIVTLGGDITEIVYSLCEGQRLVARDTTSTFPPEAKALPDVGYFRQLGAEGVLSLKPDLILASASAGPPEVFEQIASTGVAIVRLADGHSGEGLIEKVKRISRALGVAEKGADLAAKLTRDLADTKTAVASLSGRPKVLFIVNSGGGSPMAAGRDTAADALIELAAADNAFSSHKGYKAISLEAAAAAGPDAIAMMDHTLKAMGGVSGVSGHPALWLTPAAKSKRIVAREGSFLLGFGPRLPKAILDFARAIRGQEPS